MQKAENQVREFMVKAGQECPTKPTIPSEEVRLLRAKLILEEAFETVDALGIEICNVKAEEFEYRIFGDGNMELIADGCADLKVVTIGTEVACGIPSAKTWEEVHRSNMSKFIDGHKREDGKWIKGPSFQLPDLKSILEEELSIANGLKQNEENIPKICPVCRGTKLVEVPDWEVELHQSNYMDCPNCYKR